MSHLNNYWLQLSIKSTQVMPCNHHSTIGIQGLLCGKARVHIRSVTYRTCSARSWRVHAESHLPWPRMFLPGDCVFPLLPEHFTFFQVPILTLVLCSHVGPYRPWLSWKACWFSACTFMWGAHTDTLYCHHHHHPSPFAPNILFLQKLMLIRLIGAAL